MLLPLLMIVIPKMLGLPIAIVRATQWNQHIPLEVYYLLKVWMQKI